MSKYIKEYTIFIASPGDVLTEREAVIEVVRELNLTTATILDSKVNIIRWETHSYPDFGVDAQDVINKQINNDFDIFLGIMWSRFGTQTKRAESGTQEEFLLAYDKWKKDNGKIKLMFYFKSAPVPFDQIDTQQIQLIRDFKSDIKEKGGFICDFKDADNFRQLLKIHLNNALVDLVRSDGRKETNNAQKNNSNAQIAIVEDERVEEIGLFESLDLVEDRFSDCKASILKISEYLGELTEKFVEKTEVLNRVAQLSNEAKLLAGRRISDQMADDIMNFVNRTSAEIPIYKNLYQTGFAAFSNAYSIWSAMGNSGEQMDEAKESVIVLRDGLNNGLTGISTFKDAIMTFPHMTTKLIKAKKQILATLENLIDEFEFSLTLIHEFEKKL